MASDVANPRLGGEPLEPLRRPVRDCLHEDVPAVPGTAPDPPCGEFDVEAVAEDGTRHRAPLASATKIPFADMTPADRIKARKRQRNLPGRWWPVMAQLSLLPDVPVKLAGDGRGASTRRWSALVLLMRQGGEAPLAD